MKVLVVDDSVVFRSQIKDAINTLPGVEVVGVASNGKIAIEKIKQSEIDLITLDMEMPVLNGLQTLEQIVQEKLDVKVLVFASKTARGADDTLKALELGAIDFIAKPSGSSSSLDESLEKIKVELLPKITQFMGNNKTNKVRVLKKPPENRFVKKTMGIFKPQCIVIASSTGGPAALEFALKGLEDPLNCPILIAQHMPPVFTQSLARRIQSISGIACDEAKHDEVLATNRIYVCPGDFHMKLKKTDMGIQIKLDKEGLRNNIRPAADYLFESAVEIFGSNTLGIVLTGMGEDGKDGAVAIKNNNGGVIIQDADSCVVFGMPRSVYECGAFDEMGDLDFINQHLSRMTKNFKIMRNIS